MKKFGCEKYFLGLNIGTHSVGYAVTDQNYSLIKFKGKSMWGTTTFEAGHLAAERRMFRTARRRIDRRQARVALLQELFAQPISQIDPRFFQRLANARLLRDATEDRHTLFDDAGFTDTDYHRQWPTIHHLIVELMQSSDPHDVRLVYLACAWLVAHRGHFLFAVDGKSADALLDFGEVLHRFRDWLSLNGYPTLWPGSVPEDIVKSVLSKKLGVTKKMALYVERLLGGRKPAKEPTEDCPFSEELAVKLLCGATVPLNNLYGNPEYSDLKSVSLSDDDAEFAEKVNLLGDDGELLLRLREVFDCALLSSAQNGCNTISEAKVRVYEQHKTDLAWLKDFIRKYLPDSWKEVFTPVAGKANYAAYSYHVRHPKDDNFKRAGKVEFCKFLEKLLKNVDVADKDKSAYEDVLERLGTASFLPRQRDPDNRVIPQQLHRVELKRLLETAAGYLPFLSDRDADGFSTAEKILSVFDHRIPYFVGPLNASSPHAWLKRKAKGRILPWNFAEKVDLDASEEGFIRRMTNFCTYLPGQLVLPKNSILYSRFMVLNEIAPLRVDGQPISAESRKGIFTDCFMHHPRVRLSDIRNWLIAHGMAQKDSVVSGADKMLKSSMRPLLAFITQADGRWQSKLPSGYDFSEQDIEKILERMAFTEDKRRLKNWLLRSWPVLTEADARYIANLGFKDFGRLSKEFLTGIKGVCKSTGEVMSIMDALWTTGDNLNGLLSSRYTFADAVKKATEDHYATNQASLEDQLNELRLSGTVRRSVYRTLAIVSDIEKAMGHAPAKVFIKMSRGDREDRKGKRTKSRRDQLLELYQALADDDARMLAKDLERMDDAAASRLQGDKLYLYYMQLGKCMYTGESICLKDLANDNLYNIDHIYPKSLVKDDSVLNNKVLVKSKENAKKSDTYPVDEEIRHNMHTFWRHLRECGLLSEEKFHRLTRATEFSDEEKWGFISRQLVETRQSTKAVAHLLTERFGKKTGIVYVNAGLVSDFRQTFGLLKSRAVNNLHHAKDAYLNIVVGNVWDARFSRARFNPNMRYSIKTESVFGRPVMLGETTIWDGERSIAAVKTVMEGNTVHLTRFTFCRKSDGFFDQMPLRARVSETYARIKRDLPVEKYGGYKNVHAAFYLLAAYSEGKNRDAMLVPVDLVDAASATRDAASEEEYAARKISQILNGKCVRDVKLLLGGRKIKINSVLSCDGLLLTIRGKINKGNGIITRLLSPLILGNADETYVKRLERFTEKAAKNPKLVPSAQYDRITAEANTALYDKLAEKMGNAFFRRCPGNMADALAKGRETFCRLNAARQAKVLLTVISWFGEAGFCDISDIGGTKKMGSKCPSARLSAWKKTYSDVRLLDMSASGLFVHDSGNLLDLI